LLSESTIDEKPFWSDGQDSTHAIPSWPPHTASQESPRAPITQRQETCPTANPLRLPSDQSKIKASTADNPAAVKIRCSFTPAVVAVVPVVLVAVVVEVPEVVCVKLPVVAEVVEVIEVVPVKVVLVPVVPVIDSVVKLTVVPEVVEVLEVVPVEVVFVSVVCVIDSVVSVVDSVVCVIVSRPQALDEAKHTGLEDVHDTEPHVQGNTPLSLLPSVTVQGASLQMTKLSDAVNVLLPAAWLKKLQRWPSELEKHDVEQPGGLLDDEPE
jgi:hypothetical protein